MSLLPLLQASPVIQLHVGAALLAIVVGPFALYRGQRDRIHKVLGYFWVLAMGVVATSSFWIHSFAVIGPFSPIHGFALFTYWSLYTGLRHVFAGRIALHRLAMRSLYWHGLWIAGLFNFLPGRVTNRIFFGSQPDLGYLVLALGLGAMLAWGVRARRGIRAI